MRCVWLVAALGWGLAGCGCESPVIEGGTERTRDIIRGALDDFFAGVPEGSVCMPTVKVSALSDRIMLDYDAEARVIRIDQGDPPDETRDRAEWEFTTFQACLAAERQLGLDILPTDLWSIEEAYVRNQYEDHDLPVVAFALTCSIGAVGAQLLGDVCPDDPAGAEAFPFVRDEVFTVPVTAAGPVNFQWQGVGSTELVGADTVGFSVSMDTAGSLRLALLDGTAIIHVHSATGQPAPLSPRATVKGVEPEILGVDVLSWASTEEGSLLVIEGHAANGASARRLVFQGEDGPARLECTRPQETVFAADGMFWSAYAKGDNVRWGVWRRG